MNIKDQIPFIKEYEEFIFPNFCEVMNILEKYNIGLKVNVIVYNDRISYTQKLNYSDKEMMDFNKYGLAYIKLSKISSKLNNSDIINFIGSNGFGYKDLLEFCSSRNLKFDSTSDKIYIYPSYNVVRDAKIKDLLK